VNALNGLTWESMRGTSEGRDTNEPDDDIPSIGTRSQVSVPVRLGVWRSVLGGRLGLCMRRGGVGGC
jgi:hypothetical protein